MIDNTNEFQFYGIFCLNIFENFYMSTPEEIFLDSPLIISGLSKQQNIAEQPFKAKRTLPLSPSPKFSSEFLFPHSSGCVDCENLYQAILRESRSSRRLKHQEHKRWVFHSPFALFSVCFRFQLWLPREKRVSQEKVVC